MGKSTISMAIFNSFLYVYQRVQGKPRFRISGKVCTPIRLPSSSYLSDDSLGLTIESPMSSIYCLQRVYRFYMISHASIFCIYVCVIYDMFIWPVVGQSAVFASRMSNARRHPNGRIHVGKYEPLHLAGVYTGSPPPPVTAIRKLMETHAFHQRFDLSIVHNNSLRWLRMRGTSPTIGRDISSVNQSLGNPAKLSSQIAVERENHRAKWGLLGG